MTGENSKPENNESRRDEEDATELTGPAADDPTELADSADTPTEVAQDEPTQISEDTATQLTDDPTELSDTGDAAATTAAPIGGQIAPGYMLKDRFRLEKRLGAGAMGAVFLATDQRRVETQHHDTSVAIKVIAGDFSKDSRAFIALQRETDKSQTLAHPNIITVYDFDRDGDTFFMTMEALSGTTLDDYIKEGQGERKQVLAYIEDIASAIAYAHRRSIVHSDLKPQNIFVTGDGTLKVLDFGIARAFSAMDDNAAASKDPGEVGGLTPTYASCEMFERAEPHPADDVYAIGLIAYEMLTGAHPFARKKAIDARTEGLKPKRIKGLSGYQWHAISKALAFDRADRWQSAEEFRRKFSGVGRRVRQLSAALAIAVLGFGSFMLLYEPESGPDIPFQELAPATQQEFNSALNEAQQARRFGDLNGALFYLDQAYSLHPRNPRAMEAIDSLLDEILAPMNEPASAEERARHLAQIKELQKYESLEQNPRLTAKRKALEQQTE